MPQAILPRPVENPCFKENNKDNQLVVPKYEQNQVDRISISSSSQSGRETEEEDEDEFDNTIVVNGQAHLPHFGTVSVVNSNDVHFGNKTVYKGPVTIKQFVYPKGGVLDSDCVSDVIGLNGYVHEIKAPPGGGVDNKSFVRDENGAVGEDKPEEREQETNHTVDRFRKGVKWFKTIPFRKPKETMLFLFLLLISIITISAILVLKNPPRVIKIKNGYENAEEENSHPVDYSPEADAALSDKLRIVERVNWLAQPPSGPLDNLTLPVSLVIIQHTATVACNSQASCVLQTRITQTFHLESRSWNDIAYNFLIGGDGAVYEGRGWTKIGSHTLGYNNISIGVGFIGTFNTDPPPQKMLNAFHNLIARGVKFGYVTENFKVMGARQFGGTESPGKAFQEVIKTWKHWAEKL